MSVPEPPGDASADLRALQREIEQVHAEVHELKEQVADLQRAWATLPRWLRWWAGSASPQ
jgi:hypothetical protein